MERLVSCCLSSAVFGAVVTAAVATVLVCIVGNAVGDYGFALDQFCRAIVKSLPAGVVAGIFFGAALCGRISKDQLRGAQ